jgi:hypothetical protein
MQKTLNAILFFIAFISYSQNQSEEKFLFEHKLTKETQKDSLKKHIEIIKEISTTSNIDSISVDSKWELLYLHETGWVERLPNLSTNINELYIGKKNNSVSYEELLYIFKISNQKELVLDQFPSQLEVEPRGASMNGKWALIFLKKNYITLQYIHSYPNGNQTSWFRKTNYYLKKIN